MEVRLTNFHYLMDFYEVRSASNLLKLSPHLIAIRRSGLGAFLYLTEVL
jgi:hypothetical protein